MRASLGHLWLEGYLGMGDPLVNPLEDERLIS